MMKIGVAQESNQETAKITKWSLRQLSLEAYIKQK